jgi:tetratricopeptide (TPR) repeat protein/predicted Ser/Thr protein kinase
MANQGDDSSANAPTLDMDDPAPNDSFDDLLVKLVRTPRPTTTGIDELAVGTEIADRFRIERVLGAGGMGTVYVARDRALDREVAIKLHHHAGGADRLRREAIAMARLAHPNVVTVFEVGELARRPFVVMEYIAGTTLRAWLGAATRTVDEILAVVVAAGEGLAAAHAAGLVHRDFKPENVLIGSDGRARVGDFGLARELDSIDPAASPTSIDEPFPERSARLHPMTQTGAVLGTPAYMSPEQFAGAPVDARADQFAYCVTVWEALWGGRPFAGATFEQLQHAITAGERSAPPATPPVPARVRAALERGLSNAPGDRFPSLHALLAELRPPPRRRARWIAAGAIGLAVIVAAGSWLPRGETAHEMCGHARELTGEAWSAGRRIAVSSAFGRSGRAHADQAFAQVADRIDLRTRDWIAARVGACEATHVRGEQSPQLLDLRMRCLDRKLGELRAVVDVLAAGDAAVVDHAVEAVAALPPLDDCADAAALARAVPLSDNPVVRSRIGALDHQLAGVVARRAAGQYVEALPLAEALDREAATVDYAPLRARIAGERATVLQALGRGAPAETAWFDALRHASRARDDQLVFAAWRALIDVRVAATRLVGTDVLVEAATATALRLDPGGPGQALLDQSLAALFVLAGRLPDARGHATAARDWFVGHAAGSLEEAEAQRVVSTVLSETGDVTGALAANARALAIVAPALGADHPRVARLHQNRSTLLTLASRFDDALVELTDLIAPIERAYGARSVPRAGLAFAIGEVDRKRGAYPAAVAAYQQALAIYRTADDSTEIARALVGLGSAEQAAEHPDVARRYLEQARAAAERALPTSERLLSGILVYLADTRQGDELPKAQDELRRALEIRTRLYGPDSTPVAQVLNSLGTNYTWLGEHDLATTTVLRAIAIEQPALGADAFDVLIARHNLGIELVNQGRVAEALAEHERAVAGFDRILGRDHPTIAAPLALLAFEDAALGRAAEGIAAADRARAILAKANQPSNAYLDLGSGAALWALGKERARGDALVRGAIAQLRTSREDPFALARAEAWLRTHRWGPR